ncbi:MAG TPA: phage tail tape measure protein [Thermaerobacter sp.]
MALSQVLGEALVPIRAQLDQLEKDLKKAESVTKQSLGQAMQDVGKSLRDTGQTLSTYVTLPIVGAAGAAVKLAGDFEYSMNVLRSVSGATNQQLAQMRQLAIDLGSDMTLPGTSAIDAAQAMTELVKAGVSVEQTMKAARGVLVLAAAAEIDNAEAAQITANALNAFNLSGDKATYVADLLANAANAASGEITDMAYGLRQSAAVAAMAGQDIADVVTALSLMANAGIQGSDAGTSLKQMFLSLINPSSKAKKLMKELGIELFTASGQLKPLPQLIDEFRGALQNLTPAQRNQALATIFGADAIRAANIVLMSSTEEWNNMRAAVTRAGGAQDVAAAKMEGFRGALEAFRSNLETVGITLGTILLPPLTEALRYLTQLLDRVNSLPQPVQTLLLVLAGLAAAIGPLLIGLGLLTSSLGSLMTQGPLLAAKFAQVAMAAGPVLLVIGALAAAAYLLWQNWGTVGPELAALWEQVKARVQPALDGMRLTIGQLVAYIQERWPQIRQTLQTFLDWVAPIFRTVWGFVKDTVLFYVGVIAGIIQGFVKVVSGIIRFFAAVLAGDWRGAWEAVKQIVSGAVQFLWNLFKLWIVGRIASLISGALGGILRYVTSWASNLLKPVTSGLSRMGSTVSSGLSRIVGFFANFVRSALNQIAGMGSRLWSIGRNLVDSLWRGISSLGTWLKNKLLGFAKNIIPGPIARALGISSPSKLMMGFGEEIVRGLALGIRQNAREVASAAQQMALMVRALGGEAGALDLRLAAAPVVAATGAAAGGPMTVIVPVQLNDREIARVVAPVMNEELARIQRLDQRARGVIR